MSNQNRAAQARIAKRHGVKKARQQGDKAVRQALDTMHKEAAEEAAAVKANKVEGPAED